MSKSVLVIDTPEKCIRCPLLNDADECTVQDANANFNAGYSWDELMKGCPLKLLPDKMKLTGVYGREYFQSNGKMPSYKIGWNDCLDAIKGENNNE